MCIFCDIIDHKIPSSVVYEDEKVLAILDISQVTRGHTLVMPKKHVRNIIEADEESVLACVSAAKKLAGQIVTNCKASGVNVLTNCGESAGQSVDHLHFHIIPRYDENDCVDIRFNESPKQDLDEVLKTIKG
ncbi:MAG: HIT family protein [Solobacterium sp.]|nr:HIT family protein [Solobacterium sp.]MBQ9823320.1 HIT family protein [Solobacterium sp.]